MSTTYITHFTYKNWTAIGNERKPSSIFELDLERFYWQWSTWERNQSFVKISYFDFPGMILGVCITNVPPKNAMTMWMEYLKNDNPKIGDFNVIFNLDISENNLPITY